MKEIVLDKKDVYKIINEEIVKFSEKLEQNAVIDKFTKEFSSVFVESLDLDNSEKQSKIFNEVNTFLQKYKKEILESIIDHTVLSNKEQQLVILNHSDREIKNIIESVKKSLKESKSSTSNLILTGDLFYGEEDTSLKLVEYKGRDVFVNTPFLGSIKKYKMFVESNGVVEKVEFGEKNMSIKKTPVNSKHKSIWVCKEWLTK